MNTRQYVAMPFQLQFVCRTYEAENVESFFFIAMPPFMFKAGQYLVCTLPHAGVDQRGTERAFTIASAPSEPLVRLTTRVADPSSSFKRALMHLTPGTIIEAEGPYGDFVFHDDEMPSVFIAGGIGITPFRSILAELASLGHRRQITVLYSSSTPQVGFRHFLDNLATGWPALHVVYTVTRESSNWHGPTGRIDAEFIREHAPLAHAARFYVCGPTPMVSAIRATLAQIGITSSHVVHETFPGYELAEPSSAVARAA